MSKELIILGLGRTRVECPYDHEVWGINHTYSCAKRLDKLFFFDDLNTERMQSGRPAEQFMAELKMLNKYIPFVTNRTYEELPNITIYPIEEIVAHFKTRFFANTACYMLALAIYEKWDRIELYGIDHPMNSEYVMAKGCTETWVTRALERGIEVYIPEGSALMKTVDDKMYGYDGVDIKDGERIVAP